MKTKSKRNPKKSATPSVNPLPLGSPDAPIKGPVIRDGLKCFSPYDLSRYELAQHRFINMKQSVELKEFEIEKYQREANIRLRQMQAENERLKQIQKTEEGRLTELRQELEKLYDVDFNQLVYDEETGKLLVNDKPIPA